MIGWNGVYKVDGGVLKIPTEGGMELKECTIYRNVPGLLPLETLGEIEQLRLYRWIDWVYDTGVLGALQIFGVLKILQLPLCGIAVE